MEWVEVRGETLEAAKEEALDQLGVAREDAEFEVVQEPESRWLGFKKTEARVRARVRPTQPRPKKEGRGNRRRRSGGGGGQGRGGNGRRTQDGAKGGRPAKKGGSDDRNRAGGNGRGEARADKQGGTQERAGQAPKSDKQQKKASAERPPKATKEAPVSDDAPNETMSVEEQQQAAEEFLRGLAEGFGLDADVASAMDDDILVTSVNGSDLGLMIGPKGGTMHAIQELARAAVQRRSDGRDTGRLIVDVAGYRERRRAALAEFAGRQAQRVIDDGVEVALEPMGSADRKAIHDAVIDIDGVNSISEGDEPRRRVVLVPAGD